MIHLNRAMTSAIPKLNTSLQPQRSISFHVKNRSEWLGVVPMVLFGAGALVGGIKGATDGVDEAIRESMLKKKFNILEAAYKISLYGVARGILGVFEGGTETLLFPIMYPMIKMSEYCYDIPKQAEESEF